MDNELAALANEETVEEAAEDALAAAMSNKEIMEPSEEPLESVARTGCQKEEEIQENQVENDDDDDDADKSDDEVTWELQSGDSFFMCEASAGVSSSGPAPPEGVKAPSGTFKDQPAFSFLEHFGLTEIPNVQECGIGVHATTNCWQVRYPSLEKKSTARSWGQLKKGYVSPCMALLLCLRWAWSAHHVLHPECKYTKTRLQVLDGAIVADLGRDVK